MRIIGIFTYIYALYMFGVHYQLLARRENPAARQPVS